MKFIKSDGGKLINVDRVQYFRISYESHVNAVFGVITRSDGVVVAYDEVTIKKFKSRDEAETWLDATFKSVTCHVDD